MEQNHYKNDLSVPPKSIIKVIGVGGGGSNAVNYMFNRGIRDVEFIVCNTDVQALNMSSVPTKLQIGIGLTEGLGAGANPEVGREAAIESREQIRELLSHNTKMVFITAGMGGGTGTGAAPVIAEIAKELGILTVAIVTAPFSFEGPRKRKHAVTGIEQLKDNCDAILVIPNDKLREIYGNLKMSEAFAQADNILTMAAKGIAEIITVPGIINVDFEDVKTVMKSAGAVVMGSAKAEGEDRAIRVAQEALNSPLLNTQAVFGAQKILLSIMHGDKNEPQMDEITQITDYIAEKVGEDVDLIFGTAVDPSLGTAIRVIIIAAGFQDNTTEIIGKKPSAQVGNSNHYTHTPYITPTNNGQQANAATSSVNISQEFANILDNKVPTNSHPPEQKQEIEKLVSKGTYKYPQENENKPQEERSITFEIHSKPQFYTYQEATPEPAYEQDDESILKNTAAAEQKIVYDLDSDTQQNFEQSHIAPSNYQTKKEELLKQTNERIDKLRKISRSIEGESGFKEKIEIPAYLRRNVKIDDVEKPKQDGIKFNLDDEKPYNGSSQFFVDDIE